MNAELAWTCKLLLSEEVARRDHLSLATDQNEAHVLSMGLTPEEVMLRILGRRYMGALIRVDLCRVINSYGRIKEYGKCSDGSYHQTAQTSWRGVR